MAERTEESSAVCKKRKTFEVARCSRPQVSTAQRPRVSSLFQSERIVCPPSDEVVLKLGSARVCMGIDVETNDYVDGKKPYCVGRFGHGCWCSHADLEFRLVQIGWATSACAKNDSIHGHSERLIQLDQYIISQKATTKHGITNERVASYGLPLPQVLEEFMVAAWSLHEAGGVIVSHHLEFDSGIIDEELRRCGMEKWRAHWQVVASRGICTLDLDTQEWFQRAFGRIRSRGEKTLVLNLKDSVLLFYRTQPRIHELLKKAHTAGADAELHILLFQALRGLADRDSQPLT